MAGTRLPGPGGLDLSAHSRAAPPSVPRDGCIAGALPGPALGAPRRPERAGKGAFGPPSPSGVDAPAPAPTLARFTTDELLLTLAQTVELKPAKDCSVFYAEDEGRAAAFVRENPTHTRLDELLARTVEGRTLLQRLIGSARPWSDFEEVWWTLSHRFARASSGVVQVFGPKRLQDDGPLDAHRSAHTAIVGGVRRTAWVNTVFEKVELPELEANPDVSTIYYNGKRFN